MGTNECNLELHLQPSHLPQQPADDDSIISPARVPRQLTIFYNGQVCVSDVTELQAKGILMFARREMPGLGLGSPSRGSSTTSPDRQDEDDSGISPPKGQYSRAASAQQPQIQMLCPAPALSMKRSLQRFLQKRRHRVLATNPYNVR